jgi:GNAT superfamily N-acetyltransferase
VGRVTSPARPPWAHDVTTRAGHDSDADAIIALIGACWARYPGVRMDVDGEMPELRALANYYASQGGALWVAKDRAGTLVGMIATRPIGDGAWEICRVYVDPARHGDGLGAALLARAEAHAIAAGATRLALWSDTRFIRAHRFYEKYSYVRSGPIRALDDISNSLEYAYAKPVNGIETLDAAAAHAAEPRLSALLIACVAEGAGVSFLHPLDRETARRFWHDSARAVARGEKIIVAGWVGGALAGTVTLVPASAQNQPHRADVAKLLVDPATRRQGLARRLMARLEVEARRVGRPRLMLDTRVEGDAVTLYRALGWREIGVMPGHALRPSGGLDNTMFFWKDVGEG